MEKNLNLDNYSKIEIWQKFQFDQKFKFDQKSKSFFQKSKIGKKLEFNQKNEIWPTINWKITINYDASGRYLPAREPVTILGNSYWNLRLVATLLLVTITSPKVGYSEDINDDSTLRICKSINIIKRNPSFRIKTLKS